MISNMNNLLTILDKKHYKGKKICLLSKESVLSKSINFLPSLLMIKFCLSSEIKEEEALLFEILTDNLEIKFIYAIQEKLMMLRKVNKGKGNSDERMLIQNSVEIKYRFLI